MPTGYTADVGDGKVTAFPDFAAKCARAFGALILMRDDPVDAPTPETFSPSEYHIGALAKARETLSDALAWSHEEADRRAEAFYQTNLADHERYEATKATTRARYEAMLVEVRAWQPPTPDHDGLKKFMVEQLTGSISFDCPSSLSGPTRQTGREYRDGVLERARHDIEYHAKENAKEISRAVERTAWVTALRESLASATEAASSPRPS